MEAEWAGAARRFRVSRATATKWVRRYRGEGEGGLRRERGWGPHRIAWALGMAHSTAYSVLRLARLRRRDRMHRVSREAVRYERGRPGELLHPGVKKPGRVPPGGGKRFCPASPRPAAQAEEQGGRGGTDCVHAAAAGHSRYAYAEALPDERGVTTAAFLERAISRFAGLGVRVERVLTDNGGNFISGAFRETAAAHGGYGGRGRTVRRPTARPRRSPRSCRTSGHTAAPMPRTRSSSARSRSSWASTITPVRTAASAGPPPLACNNVSGNYNSGATTARSGPGNTCRTRPPGGT